MQKLLLVLLPLLALTSCNLFNNNGKKLLIGKNEMYYKGKELTEADAQKVGDFLVKKEWFDDKTPATAQLTIDSGVYTVHLVVNKEKLTPAIKVNMWKLQYDLSQEVFGGKEAKFVFTNDAMKDIETFDPVSKHAVARGSIYYDNKAFGKDAVTALGDYFAANKFMNNEKDVDVLLRKEAGTPVLRLIVDKAMVEQNEAAVIPIFSYWQSVLQTQILNDKTAQIQLATTEFVDFKKIPAITADELKAIEDELQLNEVQPVESSVEEEQ